MDLTLSKEMTNLLKGIAILFILLGHLRLLPVAYFGVAIFLIVSGYGLYMSYLKNDLKHFFQKRFLKIMIPYWIVTLIWFLIDYYIFNISYEKNNIFFTFLGFFNHVDVTMWFISFIIFYYISFFIIFKISKRKKRINCIFTFYRYFYWIFFI